MATITSRLIVFVLTVYVFTCSSCVHFYYAPNQHNVPLFREKNEVSFSGTVNLTGTAGSIQAAYATSKESAILANALIVNPFAGTLNDGKGQLYELGAGYFKPFGFKKETWLSPKFNFDVYGVFGFGTVKNFYDTSSYWANDRPTFYPYNNINIKLFKAYIQPSIAFSSNIVDVILSTKIGLVHTFDLQTTIPDSVISDYASGGNDPYNDWQALRDHRTPFIFEPALTVRIGYKYVKVHAQVTGAITNPDFQLVTVPFTFNFGLSFDIARRFMKKKVGVPTYGRL